MLQRIHESVYAACQQGVDRVEAGDPRGNVRNSVKTPAAWEPAEFEEENINCHESQPEGRG